MTAEERAAHTDDKRAHSPFGNSENASRAALVERVARQMYDELEGPIADQDYGRQCRQWERCVKMATAAIDLIRVEVLEEAALRAEDFLGEAWEGYEIAAAIRALKDRP